MSKLTIGSCFSGIGGLELGLEWTGGFETKWQIEMDGFASKVLEKHWPNVQRYSDIRDVVRPPSVDLICGGFPCQDVSLAGKRAGLGGARSTLWGEMFRLICEIKPRWVVAENVPGLLSSDDGQFFGNILRDLAGSGYDAEWRMFRASEYGAIHRRERIFILAYPNSVRLEKDATETVLCGKTDQGKRDNGHPFAIHRKNLLQVESGTRTVEAESLFMGSRDGFPFRVDRIKCLGNAVVPQVAQKIGEMILKYEKEFGE